MENYPNNPKYKIIEQIGHGAFGLAFKVINTEDNNIYVIKKIILKNATKEEIQSIEKESKILSNFNSEYIVKYIESWKDNESFNIVMEYCEGLDLRRFINEHKEKNQLIDEFLIYFFIYDICHGLKSIHNKNLIHRDLKPDNLFVTSENKLKIGDFGLSKQLKS